MMSIAESLPLDILRQWCALIMDEAVHGERSTSDVARLALACTRTAHVMRKQTHHVAQLRELALKRYLSSACEHVVTRMSAAGDDSYEDQHGRIWGVEPALRAGAVSVYPPRSSLAYSSPVTRIFRYRIHIEGDAMSVVSSWLRQFCHPLANSPFTQTVGGDFTTIVYMDELVDPTMQRDVWSPLSVCLTRHARHTSVTVRWTQLDSWDTAPQWRASCKELTYMLLVTVADGNLDATRQWRFGK